VGNSPTGNGFIIPQDIAGNDLPNAARNKIAST
jgi:hypothetical protein